MKKFINILLAILLSLTTFVLVISIFLYNKNFITRVITKNNIEEVVIQEIKSDIDEEIELDKDLVLKDLKNYINNGYYLNIKNKIIVNEEYKYEEIYSKYIKLFDRFNIKNIKSFLYLISFILIILSGFLFIYTKFKHNINLIILVSGILDILIYGSIFIFNNFYLAEEIIFNNILNVILFIGCLKVISSIILFNEKRLNKFFVKR